MADPAQDSHLSNIISQLYPALRLEPFRCVGLAEGRPRAAVSGQYSIRPVPLEIQSSFFLFSPFYYLFPIFFSWDRLTSLFSYLTASSLAVVPCWPLFF